MTRRVHFLGICGYAVSGAAMVAQELGYEVTGSDEDAYPPTSETLTAAGIEWRNYHDPANLLIHGQPDLVVVGNQVRQGNSEWLAAVSMELQITSESEFYYELTEQRVRIAVCGTHGKTTTAGLLAHILESAGMDPGFRLGSTSRDFGVTARLGTGPFVFEGDEYTTAPWDARPKFLHAHARLVCVTRLELDHPDVYASWDDYRGAFVELVQAVPSDGLVVLCADDPACLTLREHARAPVVTYGVSRSADWHVDRITADDDAQLFSIHSPALQVDRLRLTFPGVHNALNATAAAILAHHVGAPADSWRRAYATFRGPARRFQVLGEAGGVVVVDDYAHHPTEVAATVAGARQRYPGRRILAVYVPHTYSRTLALLDDYRESFVDCDAVYLGPIEAARERSLEGTVSSADVAARIPQRVMAKLVTDSDAALNAVLADVKEGDVVLCLSVRGFDKLAERLLGVLMSRHKSAQPMESLGNTAL